MEVIKAPNSITGRTHKKSMFLAGTIDMGNSHDWQADVSEAFKLMKVTLFNPRRDGWDSSWTQDLNSPQFNQQVNWELDALDKADIIAMYFGDGSKSPISLLELGLYASHKTGMFGDEDTKVVVYCNDFYRKGNVDIVCQRYGIPVFTNEETWINELKRRINKIT